MPKTHRCLSCGYTTLYKTHMIRHLYREQTCGDIDSMESMEMRKNYPVISIADDKHKCADCERSFKCNKSIYRHRKTCPNRGLSGEQDLRPFMHERLTSISDAFKRECAKNGDDGIVRMVKRIFAEIPENRNVRPSPERNCILVYRGEEQGGWVLDDFDDIKEAMVTQAIKVIECHTINNDRDEYRDVFPVYFRVCELLDRMKFLMSCIK